MILREISQWVKIIKGGNSSTRGYAISVDPQGNVYAAGTFRDKAKYNGQTLYTSRGSSNAIIWKFRTNGSFDWAKQIGGSGSDKPWGIAVKGAGVYVTGSLENSAKFTSSVTISSYGDADFSIAKLDTAGNYKWGKHGVWKQR